MKITKLVESGIPILCEILLSLIVLLSFLQIVLRQFFKVGLSWSGDISLYCQVWLVLLGSIWVTKHEQHMNVGIKLHQKLNKRQVCLIDSILALVIVIITAVVAYQSAIFSFSSMYLDSPSLPWLKMGYVFIMLPFAMLSFCYYYLKSFFKNFMGVFKRD
jgi:TRAP-type C4-dicarboxylate transport system permease small subunit